MDKDAAREKLSLARRLYKEQGETKEAKTLDNYPFEWGRVYYYIGKNMAGEQIFYKICPTKGQYNAFGQGEDATLFDKIFPVAHKIGQLLQDRTNYPGVLRTAGEI